VTRAGSHQLVAELVEEAHAVADPVRFPQRALERLQGAFGFDTAMLMGLSHPRRPLAMLNKEPFRPFLKRYQQEAQRYDADLIRTRKATREGRGAFIDREVYSSSELRELPFFAEITRPQGISSQLIGIIHLRGEPLAKLHLCRHGSGKGFGINELEGLRQVMPLLGIAHVAFSAPLRGGSASMEALGPRERQVAELVARGLRNREIGAMLGTSPNTVRNQLHRLFEKLDVSGRTELALWYQKANAARR